MKKINQWLALVSITVLCGSVGNLAAQDNAGGSGGQGGGRGGRGNFDPAQMQQRMLESTRERFEIKDDTEWKAIEPLVQKVSDARMANLAGGIRGMMGGRNRGGNQGDQGSNNNRPRFGGEPSAEETALTSAIGANAAKDDLKAKMAAYRKVKSEKEAALKTAQDNLKKVLNTKQEAIALEMGLVN